ncbi:MAG: hypothetical protein JWP15_3462 [Alphaproteobacteria bacterium]|nr:hypothetical protein [Alphaproteobacteria bacterium]
MKTRDSIRAVALCAAFVSTSQVRAQPFSGAAFEINRERVQLGTIKSCAKSASYLVPTTYLYITARNSQSAGGGLGNAKSKARVFVQGLGKAEVQGLAGQIQNEIVSQLRASGANVLTFDDVKGDVADKRRMETNPSYGMPTHGTRSIPGIDFFVATPNDDQTLDYGMMGPQANFAKAAQRTGATLLLTEVFVTLPQLGASASKAEGMTWRSSESKIGFDPAMHLAAARVYGLTAKGAWCSISVPEHGQRLPAPVAGQFRELGHSTQDYGDWTVKSGDFTFVVDNAAFETGILAVGRSLAHLIADSMNGPR